MKANRQKNNQPKPFRRIFIKERNRKAPMIHTEVNNAQYEVYGMLVEKYRNAYSDGQRSRIFQLMIGMRELWPSECAAWEMKFGPSF